MFGYVVANKDIMTPEQQERYKACYCGLCRSLRLRHGGRSRLTLNYDMTFLSMFLSSMYEPEEETGTERCVMHPAKEHAWFGTVYTDYAADMNIALSYLNCMDDWRDDKNLIRRGEAGALSLEYFYVSEKYPEKCAYIKSKLDELSRLESEADPDPDDGAKCFGDIMGEVFSFQTDSVWGEEIRRFGVSLGEFVYIMDAVVDLERDRKKGSYNPLLKYAEGKTDDDLRYMLRMLIGECAERFERLPLVKDADIMRNVLYSGVWLRYNAELEERRRKRGEAVEP